MTYLSNPCECHCPWQSFCRCRRPVYRASARCGVRLDLAQDGKVSGQYVEPVEHRGSEASLGQPRKRSGQVCADGRFEQQQWPDERKKHYGRIDQSLILGPGSSHRLPARRMCGENPHGAAAVRRHRRHRFASSPELYSRAGRARDHGFCKRCGTHLKKGTVEVSDAWTETVSRESAHCCPWCGVKWLAPAEDEVCQVS
jgi:hypothetical protein